MGNYYVVVFLVWQGPLGWGSVQTTPDPSCPSCLCCFRKHQENLQNVKDSCNLVDTQKAMENKQKTIEEAKDIFSRKNTKEQKGKEGQS